jgi:hypothetical protein
VLTVYKDDNKFRMYQVTQTRATQMGGIIAKESFAEGIAFNGDGIPTDTDGNDRCIIPHLAETEDDKQYQPQYETFTRFPVFNSRTRVGACDLL